MKRIDLWLDEPIEIVGKNGCTYGLVNHIDTTSEGDEYIEREAEDGGSDILYLHEMDCDEDRAKVVCVIEYCEYKRQRIFEPNFAEASIVWKDTGEWCDGRVIALNDIAKQFPEEDAAVFFYVDGIDGLCALLDRENGEDFYVLPDTVAFFEKL